VALCGCSYKTSRQPSPVRLDEGAAAPELRPVRRQMDDLVVLGIGNPDRAISWVNRDPRGAVEVTAPPELRYSLRGNELWPSKQQ